MRYITLFIGIFLYSCNQNPQKISERYEGSDSILNNETFITNTIEKSVQEVHLDTAIFKSKIDSFVTLKMQKESYTTTQIDTLRKWNEYYKYPHINAANMTIKYRVRPKSHIGLSFNLFESIFQSSEKAKEAYNKSRKEANKRFVENHIPGFSKANDFIIRADSLIFAMNAPCTYTDKDILKIKKIILESIINIPNIDTINCPCGGICDL